MQFNFTIIYLIVSVIVSLLICIYSWKIQQRRSTKPFAVACFTASLWMIGDIVGRLSENVAGEWIGEILRYLGGCFLPVALLVFIYEYCGKTISRRRISLLCILPAISWLMMLTNPWHSLFFAQTQLGMANAMRVEFGYYFWAIYLPYCYALVLTGFATVLLEISRASRHYRTQISILFFALCIPFAINIIGVFKLLGKFSYTPLSFSLFFSVMAIAIFRYRFLTSNPIAYETVFQTIRDGVIVVDQNNIITDINPAAAKSLKKTPKEIIGTSLETAFENWENLLLKYKDVPDTYDEFEIEMEGKKHFISISITPLKNAKETIDGRIFTLRDITDRKQYEFSLETLAFHDPLTRLANRYKFQEEVEIALSKSAKTGECFVILYFDLNRFKIVNDTYGHEAGDELLKYVAARTCSTLRKPDLLARLGGDEFAVLLHNCKKEDINLVITRILSNVRRPFKIGEHTIIPDLSIGAALYPQHGVNLAELLRHADRAMYQAKQEGMLNLIGEEIRVSPELNM